MYSRRGVEWNWNTNEWHGGLGMGIGGRAARAARAWCGVRMRMSTCSDSDREEEVWHVGSIGGWLGCIYVFVLCMAVIVLFTYFIFWMISDIISY